MKLFKIFLTAVVLVCVIQAQAKQKFSNRALIAKVNARFNVKKQKIQSTKFLKFFVSPAAPKVTEEVTAFIQPLTGFTDSEILLQIYLDGQLVSNAEHPATELWVADFGSFSESKVHTVSAKIFLRDKNAAKLITDAILVLDSEIADLNTQIENAFDPEVIAQLTALRDDKIAQRNELITTLAGLQSQIGEESSEFFIQENVSAPGYPKVFEIAPNVVKAFEQRSIVISGENFENVTLVNVGGTPVTITSYNSGSINATVPGLALGAHDLEVQTTTDNVIRNTILKNAVFAASQDLGNPNFRPVAVAEVVASPILHGASASITATNSFDPNGIPFFYQWRYFSGPAGANLPGPDVVTSAQPTFLFFPKVPGLYIVSLQVVQSQAPFLVSVPVFAIIEVLPPANRAPIVSASGISVLTNQTATTLVTGADADFWQSNSTMISRQSSLGTATLTNGVLTFNAGSQTGTDYITVLRFDNGTPPLAGSFDIPVSVASSNQAPVINSLSAKTVIQALPAMVKFRVDVSDPDSQSDIVSIELETGDGILERIPISGPVFGEVNHNYQAYGSKTVNLIVKDKFGATTSQQFVINVVDTDLPTAKFQISTYSCEVPCIIDTDASTSSDQQGIVKYFWNFGDGTPEEDGGVNSSHTYTTAGTYFIRLRTQDPESSEGEGWAQVWVGVTPPSNGPSTFGVITASPVREVPLNVPVSLDGGHSFDPLNGGNVSSYSWRRNGSCLVSGPNCIATGQTASFYFTGQGNFFPRLTTTNALGRSTTSANTEVIAVHSGHAPRALFTVNQVVRPQSVSGSAPFLISVDSSLSYDYEGSLVSRSWDFGDGTGGTSVVESKVYHNPGVYFLFLAVLDSDNNQHGRSQMVVVNPPGRKSSRSKQRSAASDETEQYLVQACGRDDGEACYMLANIYLEQGNTFVYEKLIERACALSYQPACTKRKKGATK